MEGLKIRICKKCGEENPDYLNNCNKCGSNLVSDVDLNKSDSVINFDDEYKLPKKFKTISLIIAVIIILILAPLGYLAYNEYSQDEMFYDTIDNVTNAEQPYKDQSFDIIQIVNETDYVRDFYKNYSMVLDDKISKLEDMKPKLSNPDYVEFTDIVLEESKLKKEAAIKMEDLLNDVDTLNKNNDSRAFSNITQKQESFERLLNESEAVSDRTTEFIKNHQEIKENFNSRGLEV